MALALEPAAPQNIQQLTSDTQGSELIPSARMQVPCETMAPTHTTRTLESTAPTVELTTPAAVAHTDGAPFVDIGILRGPIQPLYRPIVHLRIPKAVITLASDSAQATQAKNEKERNSETEQ